ncbi:hypothetical protein HDU81_008997 [Chytriomyces hyalinus]|nr:hypothetical protein HDU81_008997 [Chytriomyces hyalinus]
MFSWIGNLIHGISAADPVEDARNASESRLLSDAEIDHVVSTFQSLQSTTNKVDFEAVEKWVKQKSGSEAIAQSFVVCMWSNMLSNSAPASNSDIASEASVSMRDFVASVALCSRGSWSARKHMVLSMAKDSLELASIVGSALSLFTDQQSLTARHVVTPRFAKFLVKESNAPKSERDPFDHEPKDAIPDIKTVELWAPKARLLNELWNALFGSIFFDAVPQSLQIPTIVLSEPLLLSTEDLFVLSSNIKPQSRASTSSSSSLTPTQEPWQLIYSTETNGKSWGSLTSKIEATGSLLILIRDSKGQTFGAYASSPLECCPRFYGTNDTFLFTLEPDLRIFRDVGVNSNYMYFNYGTATLPNGIGFGGQMSYFGLWIDSSFSFGTCSASPTSSTFESPQLCAPGYGDGKFEIDVMQVVLVHPKEVDDRLVPERVKKGGASILTSNPMESALLEMAGKERYSYE